MAPLMSQLDRNCLVWTYAPEGTAIGLITGREQEDGDGLLIEHIVLFPYAPPGQLLRMLHAGVKTAWDSGYLYLQLLIPQGAPSEFFTLARRMGFEAYEWDDTATWFVRYRP